jgi:hypothetical protein
VTVDRAAAVVLVPVDGVRVRVVDMGMVVVLRPTTGKRIGQPMITLVRDPRCGLEGNARSVHDQQSGGERTSHPGAILSSALGNVGDRS